MRRHTVSIGSDLAAPTPACDGERVFALFGSCVLAALDMNGQPLWRYELKDTAFDVAVGTSPILYKDLLIICADQNQKKSRMVALERASGAVKYEAPRPSAGYAHSTPVLAEVAGKSQLLVAANGALQGVDPDNGQIIWWCKSDGAGVCGSVGNGPDDAAEDRDGDG